MATNLKALISNCFQAQAESLASIGFALFVCIHLSKICNTVKINANILKKTIKKSVEHK